LLKATSPDASGDVFTVARADHPAPDASAATGPATSKNRTKPTRGDPEAAITKTASHQTGTLSSPEGVKPVVEQPAGQVLGILSSRPV
jgi:hypothetical protein